MSQKLPFNQGLAPIFVPQGPTAPVGIPFHRFDGDSDVLWSLHLWVANNGWTNGAAGAVSVSSGAVGSGTPTDLIGITYFPDIVGDPTAVGRLAKVIDGVAMRGPLDLFVVASGGIGAPVDPFQAPAVFGYVTRGDGDDKLERRFFDPGSNIGDQVASYEGGKAIGTINLNPGVWPPDWVDIHDTDDNYIDVLTLDMMRGTGAAQIGVVQFTGFPAPAGAPVALGPTTASVASLVDDSPMRVRLFDGFPVRGAGMLQAQAFSDNSDPVLWNGYFTRG